MMRRILGLIASLIVLVSCGGAPPGSAMPTQLPTSLPTAQQAPTADDLLEQAYAQLRQGQLAFNPPQQMQLSESALVRLRLTRYPNVAAPTLVAGLDPDRSVLIDNVKVGSTMRAQLSGDAFQVEPLSSEEQLVVGDAYNEWAWRLAPLAGGSHTLTLRISAVIAVGSDKLVRDFPVKETTVTVQVSNLILGGHSHHRLLRLIPIGASAIAQAGVAGAYLGVITIAERGGHPSANARSGSGDRLGLGVIAPGRRGTGLRDRHATEWRSHPRDLCA